VVAFTVRPPVYFAGLSEHGSVCAVDARTDVHRTPTPQPKGESLLQDNEVTDLQRSEFSVMARYVTSATLCFGLHLLLTAGTGNLGIWNKGELLTGLVLSLLVAALVGPVVPQGWVKVLDPRRWGLFLVYLVGPFFFAMARANLDVVYRVITGRIKPGIVRIAPNMPNDVSATLLANSITLTPGTLTVEIDEKTNDLYIHWINVDEAVLAHDPRDLCSICGSFPKWARRIAG
jgi:multicomponent Na+:H+ antiporter subunit E